METTRCALIFLVSACLWRSSCAKLSRPDVHTRRTNHPLTPANGSTSALPQTTRLSTLLTQAPTVLSTPATSTQVMSGCLPVQMSSCPQDWYQVDNDTCLIVMSFSHDTYPPYSRDLCSRHDGDPVLDANINKCTECLKYILRQSMTEPNNYEIRMDYNMYVDVQDRATEHHALYNKYNVACFQRKEYFKKPTVSVFSLNIYSKKEWGVGDNSTDYITVNTTYAGVVLTCLAEGMPKPRVIITNESGKEFNSGTWIQLYVCSQAGVYTCTASNSLGTFQAHRRIHISNALKVKITQFTAYNNRRAEIRSGDTADLRCFVDGCPDRVTLTRNKHPIAQTTNYTIPFVHEITGVNCSHMGTYTCLAKSPTGQDVQETAELEVKGSPVSLCEGEDFSQEISPILGENVTFALCLMSSEEIKSSANETKIMVKFTRNSINRFYWTVNITMYNIQEEDYRTHTVRIENSEGSLDVHFRLQDKGSANASVGQKAPRHGFLLIALPPVCFIILVFIIVVIVWYRVKGTRISRTRSKEIIDCGSCNDDNGEARGVPEGQEAKRQQEADRQEVRNTTGRHDKESGRFITEDGLIYVTVVSANKQINKRSQGGKHPSKQKSDDESRVEYITLDFAKTGKF